MLIDIKSRLDEPRVRDLLELAAYDDAEEIARAYRNDESMELTGFYKDDELAGIAGFRMNGTGELLLGHIAVLPERRGKGYGTAILLSLIGLKNPRAIVAETDADAVDFYRSVGFAIESLGEKYPGVERFRCTYDCEVEG
ncbi:MULTISPECIES: GNAT family N-acetyltransferase [Cohnella]|uniref:GNAT family N-acetyltransferase n=1 Tax=Cohnella TaxID=329857 RepID=UPI0009BA3A60|nr:MULTISPECIES: GNAT family N-acetyltransferase [Cohnella]MBN2984082.1 GNAT family N-acetyltransferase [Cohnella algarum]